MQALKNKDILLINSPVFWLKTPNLGLEYLYQYLLHKGHRPGIIDLNTHLFKKSGLARKNWLNTKDIWSFVTKNLNDGLRMLVNQISSSSAHVLGFSSFSRNREFTVNFASMLTDSCKDKTFVFGGPHILFELYRDELLDLKKAFSDAFFVAGEGFLPLEQILDSDNPLPENKTLVLKELDTLDKFPLCTFSEWDMDMFNFLPLLTHTGCVKRCRFCSECFLYRKIKYFPVNYVIEELKLIKGRFPKKFISFQDSMFNMDLDYVNDLLDAIIKNNIDISWEAQISVDKNMDMDLLKKMKKCGCSNLFVGAESFSDRVLDEMDKGYTGRDCVNFFSKLKKAGLFFEISLIVGSPPEGEKDFQETISFLKKHKNLIPKVAQANPFVPYPPSIWTRTLNKDDFLDNSVSGDRLNKLIKVLREEKIKYTPYFVSNLVYG